MLGDYLKENDPTQEDPSTMDSNADYLYGADLSLTQKYLARREKLKELSHNKKKDIDTRASKGRKIRYIVHDKLLNFMITRDNLDTLDGRDQILANLFG